jgi:acyl-CoA synthetase (AMP-forming)/AMP-acid ligase II
VIAGDVRLNFRELDERSSRIAAALKRRGVQRGMTVGLLMYTGTEYLESFFAACKIGALPFNLNYRYETDELRHLLADANASALILDSALEAKVRAALPGLPELKQLVIVPRDGKVATDDGVAYTELMAERIDATDITSDRSDDDRLLLYTGGTTGVPKGVEWTHRNLFFGGLGGGGMTHADGPVTAPAQLSERAMTGFPLVNFPLSPLMHGACLYSVLVTLFAGQTLVLNIARSFDAEYAWDIVERENVMSVSFAGDAMALPLIEAYDAHPGRWNLSTLRALSWGGAALSEKLQQAFAERFPTVMRINGLGSSESGSLARGLPPNNGEGLLRIAARDDLAIIVEGCRFAEVGEMGIIAGAGALPSGYWRDPDRTAKTFVTLKGRRWVLTGDIGRLDADGMMTFFGRDANCIMTGGEKVFAEEVEDVVKLHPAVRDAIVVGAPHERWGQVVVAVAALQPGAVLTLEEIQGHCDKLARYKRPRRLVLVDEVKRSPAGKADYRWGKITALENEPANKR